MPHYISTIEAAAKWGITKRRVNDYCKQGRISGAEKKGRDWLIPADAEKPTDPRFNNGGIIADKKEPEAAQGKAKVNISKDIENLSAPFRALIGNEGLNYQLLDLLPIPINIFAPDGTAIFVNRASMEMVGNTDASKMVGKYNLKHDPVCLEILGQELIDKIFNGESIAIPDFPAPIQNVYDRGVIEEKPFEAATMDMFLLPLWDGDTFTCTVCFFTVKNMYKGMADIAKARQYIDMNWRDEFDIDKVAQSVNLGKRQFQRIFKDVTGKTPLEYYQDTKIEKLKEKLLDHSMSVEQAFEDCGVDYYGKTYRNLFKEKVGMSPSDYRKANLLR